MGNITHLERKKLLKIEVDHFYEMYQNEKIRYFYGTREYYIINLQFKYKIKGFFV